MYNILYVFIHRLAGLLSWLEDCAVWACHGHEGGTLPGIQRPAKLHIQCVASTLYKSAQLNIFDVSSLFSDELFTYVYMYSLINR